MVVYQSCLPAAVVLLLAVVDNVLGFSMRQSSGDACIHNQC